MGVHRRARRAPEARIRAVDAEPSRGRYPPGTVVTGGIAELAATGAGIDRTVVARERRQPEVALPSERREAPSTPARHVEINSPMQPNALAVPNAQDERLDVRPDAGDVDVQRPLARRRRD